jgi:hypothetical protein
MNHESRDAKPSKGDALLFVEVIHFRCPPVLPLAVREAAERQMISASAYMRGAILERLRRDGRQSSRN